MGFHKLGEFKTRFAAYRGNTNRHKNRYYFYRKYDSGTDQPKTIGTLLICTGERTATTKGIIKTYFIRKKLEMYKDKTTVEPTTHGFGKTQKWVCIDSGDGKIELRIGSGWRNPLKEFVHLLNYFSDLLECSRPSPGKTK